MNGLTKMSASIVFVSLLLILNRNLSLGATLERHFSLIRWKKGPYINTIFTAKYFYKKETLLKLINSYQLVQLVIFFEIREKFMNSSEPLSLSLKWGFSQGENLPILSKTLYTLSPGSTKQIGISNLSVWLSNIPLYQWKIIQQDRLVCGYILP